MAIFTAIGAAIFGAGTFLAAATTFALQIVAGIGLNLLAQKIAGKKEQQQATGPGFSVQGRLNAGGDVPRSFMVGWGMTAGSLVYTNTWGPAGGTPNAYFVQVIALSDLPVQGLVAVWVSGEKCTLDDTPHADYGYPVLEYRKNGKDHLWVKFHDGTQTTADAYLVAKFGSDTVRPYESTRVGVGVAYAICTALVNDELFSGFPTYKFEINGVRLYDPSKDSSVGGDGDQRWDEPATWGGDGDHLPAVQVYNLKNGLSFGGEWFYGLQGMTAPRLPASNWIAQIEKCREMVDGPDGEEPRYRSGGEISVANQLGDAVEELLTACQGKVSEIGGFYKIHLGAPDSSVFSFTDDDIISTEEQSFTPFFGLADTINGITAKYPSPDEAWGMKPAPPVYRSDLEALAGNRRLLADVPLNFVPYHRQVQDLMQTALAEAQRARRHTLTLPPLFWLLEPGDIIEWTSARNGYVEKQFRLDGVLDKANLDVMVDLTEVDPADYDFDIETDYTPPTIGPSEVVRPVAQAIVDFDAVPDVIRDNLGLPRRPAIRLIWEGDVDDVIGVRFEVRLASDHSQIVSRGRSDNYAIGEVLISQGLVNATNYEVRGQYIPGSPREVEWSTWIPVTTPDVNITAEDLAAALRYEALQKQQQLISELQTANEHLARLIGEVDAAREEDKASISQSLTRVRGQSRAEWKKDINVAVGPSSAIAQTIEQVSAAVGNVEASLTARYIAGVTPEGAMSRYDLMLNAEAAFAGMSIIAFNDGMGGVFGNIEFRGDRFYIVGPNSDSVPLFIVDNGPPQRIYLNGDIFAPGSITASHIAAGAIDAVHIKAGAITADKINAATITAEKIVSDSLATFDFYNAATDGQTDFVRRMYHPGDPAVVWIPPSTQTVLDITHPIPSGKFIFFMQARGLSSMRAAGSTPPPVGIEHAGIGATNYSGNFGPAGLRFLIDNDVIASQKYTTNASFEAGLITQFRAIKKTAGNVRLRVLLDLGTFTFVGIPQHHAHFVTVDAEISVLQLAIVSA